MLSIKSFLKFNKIINRNYCKDFNINHLTKLNQRLIKNSKALTKSNKKLIKHSKELTELKYEFAYRIISQKNQVNLLNDRLDLLEYQLERYETNYNK